jgi:serine protease AprX
MLQVDRPDSGSARPTRAPVDRGWSLDLTASGRLGATLSAFLLVSVMAPAATLAYDPASDVNSMANTTAYTGATAWWDAGYTGQGVDVALIDTGVAPVDGLDGANKIVYGPDLSLESQAPELRNLDTNGHGTFMAGIIAGNSSGYRGMAPGARIVSVKVGVADGGTDVSQVIAAIDWVVQHRHDNDLDIRVINLSYGTNSAQDAKVDPLAFAAERAWKEGIVVVVAGGNYGFQNHMNNAPALADPAIDRYVLAVGSSDSAGTMTQADDKVPAFSPWPKRGATRGVDMIAPGAHIQGLRVPDSYLDQTYPEGQLDSRFFRGSGTSESAAMVSGAAALILQKYPDATPNEVKKLLTTAAVTISGKAQAIGGGELQLVPALPGPVSSGAQTWPSATGTGSLDQSRGTDRLTLDGVVLDGEQDIFGQHFDSDAMAALEATEHSWSGGTWNENVWTGSSWSGNSWSGHSWSGNSWSGNSWSSSSWSGNSWSGSSWSGSSWSGNSWSGNSWSGNSWSTASWD